MPSKKKKYNARFPAGRIKKIMQTDEEVGKVAQAVPVIISRTLELFVESLLTKTLRITNARNAKTLSPSHMKQCIISESRFDFLRDLVKNIPDIGVNEEQLSGSETGYEATTTGAVAATPSSSSTSPSNGGSDSVTLAAQPSAGTSSLQRSESYTPASSSSCGAVNYAGTLPVKAPIQPPTQQQQGNHLKRAMNHVGFYKEISLDESGSSSSSSSSNSSSASREPPPPKLTRLHSAPAGGANIVVAATSTTTKASPSIPFKIDILPTLPAAASGSQPRGAPATAPASSSNYKITYKFEPLKDGVSQSPKVTSAVNQHQQQQQQHQPVFKLDYSNVKLPMTASNSSAAATATTRHHHPLQPTIKIDLSGISNYGTSSSNPSPSVASSPSGVAVKSSVPATPSTPLSAASSSSGVSSNSSSGSGSRNPYIFSTGSAAAAAAAAGSSSSSSSSSVAAPVYSSVSSSIPGMDEDYDDI